MAAPGPSAFPSATVAVIGHCEWAEFVEVAEVPLPGQIVHARSSLVEAAGGGAVAAVQVARLTGSCRFFTALGDDAAGNLAEERLEAKGIEVEAVRREIAQRRAFVFLDGYGERTITTIGERLGPRSDDPLPWQDLAGGGAVYFTAGDAGALRKARSATNLVATVRARAALAEAEVQVDVLVASANDLGEQYNRGEIEPVPRWVVRTDGPRGGTLESADGEVTQWASRPVPGPRGDTYGAGDSFAAGLTCGLAMGLEVREAITLGAFCGASAVRGSGPYGAQASADDLAAWRDLYSIPA